MLGFVKRLIADVVEKLNAINIKTATRAMKSNS